MSVTKISLNVFVAVAVLCAVESARPVAAADKSDRGSQWTVRKFPADQQQGPLARLIRTPDTSSGLPPYALTDQTGKVQRYVEPVPGIDLEPYVGYVVVVGHDTGRTLLASQLDLPGAIPPSTVAQRGLGASLVTDMAKANPASQWQTSSPIQTVQYQQPMAGQEFVMPQGVVPIDQSGQMMAGPPQYGGQPMMAQGGQPMMGQGGQPIYLDGPPPMDGGTCQSPGMENVWVVPGTCPQQPCPQCQPVPCQTVQPCPQPCPQACPPPPPPPLRFSVFGEALWLHPTGVDMAHAQQQDGIGGAGTVPFGTIGTVDPDYSLGFRAGGEVRFGPCESIFASYMFFENESKSNLIPPSIPGGDGAVGSLVQHPGADLTASDGPVSATYDIDFQVGDIAYRQIVTCRPDYVMSVFLGGRFAHLDQDFTQNGLFAGGNSGVINTTSDIKVDGAGPMAGIDAEHGIGCSRFSVYGRGLVAALTGEFRSHYRMFNATGDILLAESIWKDDRVIPMLDYELGVAWTGPNRHFRLSAGYLASHWFNIVSTPEFVDAVQADNYVNVGDTLSFTGAVGRVEFRW